MNVINEGFEISEELAQEFVELHSEKIQEFHKQSGESAIDFFKARTESQAGEITAPMEVCFEIPSDVSHNGKPVLFYVVFGSCDTTSGLP